MKSAHRPSSVVRGQWFALAKRLFLRRSVVVSSEHSAKSGEHRAQSLERRAESRVGHCADRLSGNRRGSRVLSADMAKALLSDGRVSARAVFFQLTVRPRSSNK